MAPTPPHPYPPPRPPFEPLPPPLRRWCWLTCWCCTPPPCKEGWTTTTPAPSRWALPTCWPPCPCGPTLMARCRCRSTWSGEWLQRFGVRGRGEALQRPGSSRRVQTSTRCVAHAARLRRGVDHASWQPIYCPSPVQEEEAAAWRGVAAPHPGLPRRPAGAAGCSGALLHAHGNIVRGPSCAGLGCWLGCRLYTWHAD